MEIKLKLFSIHREVVGKSELDIDIEEGTDIKGLIEFLIKKYPDLAKLRENTIVSLNHNYAPDDQQLQAGDEVAIFPPVGGG